MKKLFIFFVFLVIMGMNLNVHAQLTGTKTIPGDYPSIAIAIAALSGQGVGSGGVTFNVAAGHTEVSSNLVISFTANAPTAANQVIFQKSGVGANPLITAAPGTSATVDGIIKLSGADYITFDAIDLLDPTSNTGVAMMEWGYALLRASTTDGSQHNVIRNCRVTLQKISTISFGIYIANIDLAGVTITAASPDGQNSYNRVYGNSISDVDKGIYAESSSTARDIDNEIGVNGLAPNTITNFGGSLLSAMTADGVRCEGQINVKINNNIINGGAGTGGSSAVFGIIATLFGTTATAPNYEISYNQITVVTGATSQATYGIRALATANTVFIHHNIVENCNAAQTSSGFFGLVHDPTGISNAAYIHDNIVRNNTHSGTGTSTLLGGTGAINNSNVYANQVYGNVKTGASGTMYCIRAANGLTNCHSNIIYNNSIPTSSGATVSAVYGYFNSDTDPATENVYDNVFYNLSIGGASTSASGVVAGIRSTSDPLTTKNFYRNTIHSLSGVSGSTTTGGVIGIWSTAGASIKIHANKIYNLTNTGTTGSSVGIWITSGTDNQIFNNFISELKAPNSTNANGVIGINSTSTAVNSTIGLYYNSIYLTAAGGSTFGSSGISVAAGADTIAPLDMRNNIIINLSTPGSTSGFTVAYRRSSANLQNYALTSDYNIFYAGTPSPNRLIFYDGTSGDQTLPAYQARVAPRDANSRSVIVNFVNPANGDLHLTGASIGDPNLFGTPVAGITKDIDGHFRSTTAPYIGADEPSTALVLNLRINLQACSPRSNEVTVLLRSAVSPYAVVDSASGVIDSSGFVKFNFSNAANGVAYFIVVKHRNSIETWSKAGGEVFTGGVLNYDFTTSASQAFGNNQVLVNGMWSIYTGDVNQDGIVDASDISAVENDALTGVPGSVSGLPTDLTCDDFVDASDISFVENNTGVLLIRP